MTTVSPRVRTSVQENNGHRTCSPEWSMNDFRKIHRLGRGANAEVFLVSHKTDSRLQFAMKHLRVQRKNSQDDYVKELYDLASEAWILSKVSHENIIQVHGISEAMPTTFENQRYLKATEQSNSNQFFLLTEVLEETLGDRIKRWSRDGKALKKARFSFSRRQRENKKVDKNSMLDRIESTAVGIARAMEYLHEQNVVMQDLKPDNIGFDRETGMVKLFDFGLARVIAGDGPEIENAICGTPRYMAPEALQGRGGSKKADVYSFGLVLYELCTLQKPFQFSRKNQRDISVHTELVCAGGRPSLERVPDEQVRGLIADCISHDPTERPSFHEIVFVHLPEICMRKRSNMNISTRSETLILNHLDDF